MSNAQRAIETREWKAAAVIAGSVIEALLLWAVSTHPTAAQTTAILAAKASDPNIDAKRLQKDPPDKWFIGDYIAVARELDEISPATRDACKVAADYRNLIHPGRVLRTGADASYGKALLATGAMREVDQDLAKRHP